MFLSTKARLLSRSTLFYWAVGALSRRGGPLVGHLISLDPLILAISGFPLADSGSGNRVQGVDLDSAWPGYVWLVCLPVRLLLPILLLVGIADHRGVEQTDDQYITTLISFNILCLWKDACGGRLTGSATRDTSTGRLLPGLVAAPVQSYCRYICHISITNKRHQFKRISRIITCTLF